VVARVVIAAAGVAVEHAELLPDADYQQEYRKDSMAYLDRTAVETAVVYLLERQLLGLLAA